MISFQFKRFIKNPVIIVVYVACLCYVTYMIKQNNADSMNIQRWAMYSIQKAEIFFAVFLILSYYFSSAMIKNRMYEITSGSNKALFLFHLSTFILFSIFAIIITLIYSTYACWIVVKTIEEDQGAWIRIILKNYGYQFFLPQIFAILAGIGVSRIKKNLTAYTMITVIYTLFSSFFVNIIGNYTWYSRIIELFGSLLSIMTKQYDWMLDGYYMFSAEFFNFQKIFIWILVSVGICFCCFSRKKFNIIGVAALTAAVVMFLVYAQPYSYYYYDGCVPDRGESELYYQHKKYGKMMGRELKKKKAKFKIEKISGNIDIDRQLSADVVLSLKKSETTEYIFTLNHRYKISSIKVDGKPVSFEQRGDNVYIDYHQSGVKTIEFIYSGFSLQYFSGSQATFLPGYHAYIPYPGFVKLWQGYEDGEKMKDGNTFLGSEDNYCGIGYKIDYDLQIYNNKKIYTNLKETGNGRFTGKSDGVTILSSEFAHELEVGSNKIIVSSYFTSEMKLTDAAKMYQEWVDSFKYKKYLKGKKVFLSPRTEKAYFFSDDYILIPEGGLEEYEEYLKKGKYPGTTLKEHEAELEMLKKAEEK